MNPSHFPDHELLQLLQEDNALAFQHIYKRYWYKLYIVAHKRLRSREVAEEIVQNIFSKLWLNRKVIRVHTLLDAYLYTAVKYAVIDHLEKEATKKNFNTFAHYNYQDVDDSTEQRLALHDLQLHIKKAIALLPSKCQAVFLLSRTEYRTNREIAGLLGISEKTVENHITNALKVIRSVLKKTGVLLLCFEMARAIAYYLP